MKNSDGVFEWAKYSRCAGVDTSLFFQEENPDNPRSFKQFCDECPVKGDCLGTAILYGYSGVWGGTTEKERLERYSDAYITMLRDDYKESGMYNVNLKV